MTLMRPDLSVGVELLMHQIQQKGSPMRQQRAVARRFRHNVRCKPVQLSQMGISCEIDMCIHHKNQTIAFVFLGLES